MNAAQKLAGEPIAIIGMAGRYPGAPDTEALWRLIADKQDGLADYPGGRSPELDAFYAQAGSPDRPPSRRGGFLPDGDKFDAAFFEISPREAEWMDPQQRLLLELAFEAFEDAGQSMEALAGSRAGVFIGAWTNDYEVHANANSPSADFFNLSGGPLYGASSRIAYQFDLRGPDISVNAGCAASLAAIHLAVRSLRSDECSLALAGGVNLIFRHEQTQAFSRAKMLATDGRCKFGDTRANGIVRSEGMGLLVLKRLSDAGREGDRILGLIRGTAVTNGGRSGGAISTPSEAGQRQAMLDALADADVEAASIQYVEAHGTGSRAGDPIELAAIASVYGCKDEGSARRRSSPCRTGSVKSNIGHTESAAGVAGVIKVVKGFQHQLFPATLHVEQPTQAIDWASSGIVLERQGSFWEVENASPRRAAVNGLALTGMNAHVVLEDAPAATRVETRARTAYILPISAASEAALRQRARDVAASLQQMEQMAGSDGKTGLGDLCYTAAVRRTHLAHRLSVVGASAAELKRRLEIYARGEDASFVASGSAGAGRAAAQSDQQALASESLRRGQPMTAALLEALGQLYVQGQAIDWRAIYPAGNQLDLPSYPWQRERFWIERSPAAKVPGPQFADRSKPSGISSLPVSVTAAANADFAARLKLLPSNEVRGPLTVWLREQVAAVLGFHIDRALPDKTLESLGLDSLTAMELNDRVERGLHLQVSASMAWNYVTIAALAGHLETLLAAQVLRLGPKPEQGMLPQSSRLKDKEESAGRSAADMLEAELLGAEILLEHFS